MNVSTKKQFFFCEQFKDDSKSLAAISNLFPDQMIRVDYGQKELSLLIGNLAVLQLNEFVVKLKSGLIVLSQEMFLELFDCCQ